MILGRWVMALIPQERAFSVRGQQELQMVGGAS